MLKLRFSTAYDPSFASRRDAGARQRWSPALAGRSGWVGLASLALGACSTSSTFTPRSHYPPDPWVKGYSEPDDCLGGEALEARRFGLPDYPRRAWRAGAQGWVLLRLDVAADGRTENVGVERAVPESGLWGGFEGAAVDAARAWTFAPPAAPLRDCRVLMRFRMGGVSLGG